MRPGEDAATINRLSNSVIGAALEVHRIVGPGLLESVYEECLLHELVLRGIQAERQVAIPLNYKGKTLQSTYRLDVLVEGCLLIEVKAVDQLAPIHDAQILTYLKLTNLRLGLLINFNATLLKNGIHRVVNKL